MIEAFFFGVVAFGCTYWLLMYWLNNFTASEYDHDLDVGTTHVVDPDMPYPGWVHIVFFCISLVIGYIAFYLWTAL